MVPRYLFMTFKSNISPLNFMFIPGYENENIAGPVMKPDGSICVKKNYVYRY